MREVARGEERGGLEGGAYSFVFRLRNFLLLLTTHLFRDVASFLPLNRDASQRLGAQYFFSIEHI